MSDSNQPEEDSSILDQDRLLRRVPENQLVWNDGRARPSSAVFRNTELSVYIESLMVEQSRPLESALEIIRVNFDISAGGGSAAVSHVIRRTVWCLARIRKCMPAFARETARRRQFLSRQRFLVAFSTQRS